MIYTQDCFTCLFDMQNFAQFIANIGDIIVVSLDKEIQ